MPKKPGFRIGVIHAFVAVDPADDEEGICGAMIGGTMMPLITADEERFNQMRQIAQNIASLTRHPIKVVRFTTREDVGEITP